MEENLSGTKYSIFEILNVSKSHGGEMKHFIMNCYDKGFINLYHTWDKIDYWVKTTPDALDAVLEYPGIYTIRIELKENKK